jgi:hypothetical protein
MKQYRGFKIEYAKQCLTEEKYSAECRGVNLYAKTRVGIEREIDKFVDRLDQALDEALDA